MRRPTLAAALVFLSIAPELRAAAPRTVEAEDRRFVLALGSWERLHEEELREGGIAGLASSSPGAVLRLDFHGRAVAARLRTGVFERRIRVTGSPKIFAWRRFPAARVRVSLDDGPKRTVDLDGPGGWDDRVLAENLEAGAHVLRLEVEEGLLLVDRFVVGDEAFAPVRVTVTDEAGAPVSDAEVELRTGGALAALLVTQRSGSTGTCCTLAPGAYDVSAAPQDGDGFEFGGGIVDDPRLPVLHAGLSLAPGTVAELALVLPDRGDTPRAPRVVLRPALGYPVIRRPGETFPLVLRDGAEKPRVLVLEGDGGAAIPLEAQDRRSGLFGAFWPVTLPASVPPGPYALRVAGAGWEETVPRAVFVRSDWPARYAIAHVTDTHVGNVKDDWGPFRCLEAVAADAARAGAAFAVLTGDLTDFGVPSQFLRFRRGLAAFPIPAFVCEGNHDHFDGGGSWHSRGRDAFPLYLGQRSYAFTFGAGRFAVLSTGVYEGVPEAEASRAAKFLRDADGGLRALVYHYDYTEGMTPGSGPLPADQIGHIAARAGAGLLLEGHLHQPRVRRVATAVEYMAPASKDGRYALVEVDGGRVKGCEVRTVDAPGRGAPPLPGGGPALSSLEGLEKVRALWRFGAPREALEAFLSSDGDWRVRRAAAELLGLSGFARESREVLVAALSDGNPFVREEAAHAMVGAPSVANLKKALQDPEPRVRRAAVKAMGPAARSAPSPLPALLVDPDPRVGAAAARVLAASQSEEVLKEAGAGLVDSAVPVAVRRVLVEWLERSEARECEGALVRVLSDAEGRLAGDAALVLGRWRVRAAIPSLIRLLEEGLDWEQETAHVLLVRMTRVDHGFGTPENRERWERWWEEEGGG